ncbi:MAG: citrate synthase [Leptospiraceae bacterium]|nr:citrate synthase [Leptospiraceae bacterium]
MSTDHHAGLEEVKAVPSSISHIEGQSLSYRGISIEDLAANSHYEEVVYLLWYGRLPGAKELERMKSEISEYSQLPREIREYINHIPRQVHPMTALRTMVSSLALYDHESDDLSNDANQRKAVSILARMPVLLTAFERHRKAKSSVLPKPEFSFAKNFLYMLWADEPDEVSSKALDLTLMMYAEHELNASTFVARTTAATMADMYSAVTAALATLKGSLHGGANQKAMEMLLDIADPEDAEEWVKEKLSKKTRIMGFGHRVYKDGDPRVPILRKLSKELCELHGYEKYHKIAEQIEKTMQETKKLHANVDLYSGLVFYALGVPTDMFTTVFAVARSAGWIAHVLEQYENNRLIRPRAEYTGKRNESYTPLDKR